MSAPARLTELLGIRYPLIQAPMAGVATPELAAAVSNAGALGSLGIGASSPAQARAMIERTLSLTANPINVNVFCHATAPRDASREDAWLAFLKPLFDEVDAALPDRLSAIYPSYLESEDTFALLLELRPAVVSFHFGVPPTYQIDALKAVGIRTLATATNLDEANHAVGAGIDANIAQGIEAGGHRGVFDPEAPDERLPTAVLTRLLVTSLDVPVIAAGGIMDGTSIKAALDLGASAAQLGTAFILCPESSANAAYRAALKTNGPDVRGSPMPFRAGLHAAFTTDSLNGANRHWRQRLLRTPWLTMRTSSSTRRQQIWVSTDSPPSGPARARRWRENCPQPR